MKGFLYIFILFVVLSCSEEQVSNTSAGFPIKFHIDKKGDKVKPGDLVYYHVYHRNGSTVTFSSRAGGDTPSRMVVPEYANISRKPSIILDALREMSEGDSVTAFLNLDSVPVRPKGYEDAQFMEYDIALLKVEPTKNLTPEQVEERVQGNKEVSATVSTADAIKINPDGAPSTDNEPATAAGEPVIADGVNVLLKQYREGGLDPVLQKTESGLKYIVMSKGSGETPSKGQKVSVEYYGALINGKKFDSSYSRNKPFEFKLGAGQVIKGWEEGVAMMKENSTFAFFMPAELAYGKTGFPPNIPPDSELCFYMTLKSIQ
jgi:FKBP-type peptidyl-prolyl cis-trans isomerase